MNSKPGAGKSLFNLRWKNTPDVYIPPETHSRGSRVPSLVWFCLQVISEFPDQIQLPFKLIYRAPRSPPPKSFRLINNLFNATSQGESDHSDWRLDLRRLDPRLWAAIIQIFDHIPNALRTYTLPLNDELLPLIQGLKNTNTFSLVTILELPGCDALTDDSIAELRCLHTLAALDASNTRISSHGIVAFARTLIVDEPGESTPKLRGPWGLRILRIKHCAAVDSTIYHVLPCFPLLSVVDLRGTKCRPPHTSTEMAFSPCKQKPLFSSDLASSMATLQLQQQDIDLFSAPKEYQFLLRIKSLCHESVADALNLLAARQRERLAPPREKVPASSFPHWHDDIKSDDYHDHYPLHDVRYPEPGYPSEKYRSEDEETRAGSAQEEIDTDLTRAGQSLPCMAATPSALHPSDRGFSISHTAHRETRISSKPRPLKRTKMSSSPRDRHGEDSAIDCSDEPIESELDFEGGSLIAQPPTSINRRRGLHWYDADRQRANTYVPMSLAVGEHDEQLMLHRPMRRWSLLKEKLDDLLEKEAKREATRASAVPFFFAPSSTGKRKAQVGLQSMTALALQRRKAELLRTQSGPVQPAPRNPFAKMHPESTWTIESANAVTVPRIGPGIQKPLKPISTLKVPMFTQDLLEHDMSTVRDVRASETHTSALASQPTENRIATAKPIYWGTITPPSKTAVSATTTTAFSTDRGDGLQKQRIIRESDRPPTASSFSTATNSKSNESSRVPGKNKTNSQGKGKGKRTEEQPKFNWEAWASK